MDFMLLRFAHHQVNTAIGIHFAGIDGGGNPAFLQ